MKKYAGFYAPLIVPFKQYNRIIGGGVYVLYSVEGYCLYVGKTEHFKTRLVNHNSNDPESYLYDRVEVFTIEDLALCDDVEAKLISTFKPIFNKKIPNYLYQGYSNLVPPSLFKSHVTLDLIIATARDHGNYKPNTDPLLNGSRNIGVNPHPQKELVPRKRGIVTEFPTKTSVLGTVFTAAEADYLLGKPEGTTKLKFHREKFRNYEARAAKGSILVTRAGLERVFNTRLPI